MGAGLDWTVRADDFVYEYAGPVVTMVQCFGLAETSCWAELRRASVATGAIHRMAMADHPRRFAVSPDGTRIVFADPCTRSFGWADSCAGGTVANLTLKAIVP